jgi:hypothetical protein
MIEKEKYEEYCESLLNIARLTNKENSILINFDIQGITCRNVVSFIQLDGTKDVLKDSTFDCDDEFYKDFLEVFVRLYCSNMVVAFNDSVNLNADGKYTYRVITEDNDMLAINGISHDYANYLLNMNKKVSDEVVDIIDNEDGVTNTLSALILVCGIGLALMIMYLLVS